MENMLGGIIIYTIGLATGLGLPLILKKYNEPSVELKKETIVKEEPKQINSITDASLLPKDVMEEWKYGPKKEGDSLDE